MPDADPASFPLVAPASRIRGFISPDFEQAIAARAAAFALANRRDQRAESKILQALRVERRRRGTPGYDLIRHIALMRHAKAIHASKGTAQAPP